MEKICRMSHGVIVDIFEGDINNYVSPEFGLHRDDQRLGDFYEYNNLKPKIDKVYETYEATKKKADTCLPLLEEVMAVLYQFVATPAVTREGGRPVSEVVTAYWFYTMLVHERVTFEQLPDGLKRPVADFGIRELYPEYIPISWGGTKSD